MAWTNVEGWHHGRVWRGADGKPVFYIRKRRGAKVYNVSTKCSTLRAALRELDRWELDPEHYSPAGSEDQLVLNDTLIDRYALWCEASTKSRDARWREAKRRYLAWWSEKLAGRNLKTLQLSVIHEALVGASDLAKRIIAIKHLYTYLRTTGQLGAAQDPTLDALPVPQSTPSQDGPGGSKVIPQADFTAALALLPEPYADACRMMAGTGCHLSEVIRFASEGTIEAGPPAILGFLHKGGHHHRIPVEPEVVEAAKRIRARPPLARETTYKAIRRACRDAKVDAWTPGRFRATFATRAIEAGYTPPQVALYLGHKSQATTLGWYATTAVPQQVKVA